jgi:hypothetical protein
MQGGGEREAQERKSNTRGDPKSTRSKVKGKMQEGGSKKEIARRRWIISFN